MEREPGFRGGREKNLKIIDPLVVDPRSLQNGPGFQERVRSHAMFHVGFPRPGKLVMVSIGINSVAVFFVVCPIAFRCEKTKRTNTRKSIRL